MSIGRQLLEELRQDEELRKALAEELLPEALRHRELRRAMLLALSREVATKEDIEGLKSYVDARFNDVNRRISDLYGVVKASLVAIIATLISTILVPLMLRMLFHS
jgi:PAS domain-containing protein